MCHGDKMKQLVFKIIGIVTAVTNISSMYRLSNCRNDDKLRFTALSQIEVVETRPIFEKQKLCQRILLEKVMGADVR